MPWESAFCDVWGSDALFPNYSGENLLHFWNRTYRRYPQNLTMKLLCLHSKQASLVILWPN